MKEDYRVKKIADHTYRIENSFFDQMYCVVGNEKAVLIDTGTGQRGLREVISSITNLSVFVINTHGHIDHIGTDDEFDICCLQKEDWDVAEEHYSGSYPASIIPGLIKELGLDLNEKEQQDILRRKEKKSFTPIEDGNIISLGNRELEVIHLPGHTKGSIGLLETKTGLLFIGDSICSARVMLSFPYSTNISKYRNSLQNLEERKSDIKSIFAGHPQLPMDASYIKRYIDICEMVLTSQKGAAKETSVFGTFSVYCHKDISLTYTEDKLF